MGDGKVKLNVGGTSFVTTVTTIASAGRDSMLSSLIDENWKRRCAASEEYFIDRNPAYFSVLLDLLRTGELRIPAGMSEKALYREALFYGLEDHARAAKWGPLDGNRSECVVSVSGRAHGDGTAIRAAPDGGCCVAHGSMVHVYDWTLEEQHPLTLDFMDVNDVGYLNSNRIIICTNERGDHTGGMASFNIKTGKVVHNFRISNPTESKNFRAMSFSSSDQHVFASCSGRTPDCGIGMWDQSTGQHIDFFPDSFEWGLDNACKLQWLQNSNVVLVASFFPRNDTCSVNMLDMRGKERVWSWTERRDERVVTDMVVMEDFSTICLVNQFDNLGFIDMRQPQATVKWTNRFSRLKLSDSEEHCYSKLAVNGSQLFSSRGDSVFVDCCSFGETVRNVPTAKLRKSEGSLISDISIGGGRLFVLHGEENLFDVWETPVSYGIEYA